MRPTVFGHELFGPDSSILGLSHVSNSRADTPVMNTSKFRCHCKATSWLSQSQHSTFLSLHICGIPFLF